jgi:hypothetical protein
LGNSATYTRFCRIIQTVGAEFCVKQVPIPNTNIIVELYIYDCAGQSIFNQLGMNSKYFEGVSSVMVVYDISNIDSLKACPKWLEGMHGHRNFTFVTWRGHLRRHICARRLINNILHITRCQGCSAVRASNAWCSGSYTLPSECYRTVVYDSFWTRLYS